MSHMRHSYVESLGAGTAHYEKTQWTWGFRHCYFTDIIPNALILCSNWCYYTIKEGKPWRNHNALSYNVMYNVTDSHCEHLSRQAYNLYNYKSPWAILLMFTTSEKWKWKERHPGLDLTLSMTNQKLIHGMMMQSYERKSYWKSDKLR